MVVVAVQNSCTRSRLHVPFVYVTVMRVFVRAARQKMLRWVNLRARSSAGDGGGGGQSVRGALCSLASATQRQCYHCKGRVHARRLHVSVCVSLGGSPRLQAACGRACARVCLHAGHAGRAGRARNRTHHLYCMTVTAERYREMYSISSPLWAMYSKEPNIRNATTCVHTRHVSGRGGFGGCGGCGQ